MHRLRVTGGDDGLFKPEALHEIYNYSSGLPRLINTICDNALFEGFLLKANIINSQIIKTTAVDLGLNGKG